MEQYIRCLVKLAKKHKKMPVLIKQLQIDKSTWRGKVFSDKQIIYIWYDNILKNFYQESVWNDYHTFEQEFINTINKWQWEQQNNITT